LLPKETRRVLWLFYYNFKCQKILIQRREKARGIAQVVQYLTSKLKALNSNPRTTLQKKKKKN
jgi:hypothetical protein